MPRETMLDHVVIAVSDWDRSIGFYRDVIGVTIVHRGNGHALFGVGNQLLSVHGPGTNAGSLVAGLPVRPGGSDICFVWMGGLGELTEHLVRHGVAIEEGPVRRRGAGGLGNSVYFRDPDGSLLEFITYEAPSSKRGWS